MKACAALLAVSKSKKLHMADKFLTLQILFTSEIRLISLSKVNPRLWALSVDVTSATHC